ncbi:MAG TPA: 50S ribosomal protein L15 [Candidatus Babeliales bacterium]|nr:50S ribosomal protein L15 [Candidatus Babeliales bacterium]
MLRLHTLKRLVKKRKRIGRGGERGGTSTKGHKGQKARSGAHVSPKFEGGQMPIYRRLPKRGFNNTDFATIFEIVNVDRLNNVFETGAQVDAAALIDKGIIKPNKGGRNNGIVRLKVLGNGTISKKLTVIADAFSKSAEEAIKKAGGEAKLIKEM